MNDANCPPGGMGIVVVTPVDVPSSFVRVKVTIATVVDGLAIASPVWMDPTAPRLKSPARAAYSRNALADADAETPASATVTPPDRKEKITTPEGTAPLPGTMRTEPPKIVAPAPELVSFWELRAGMEYEKLL